MNKTPLNFMYRFCSGAVTVAGTLALVLLSVFALIFRTWIPMNKNEEVYVQFQSPFVWLAILAVIGLLIVLAPQIGRIPEHTLFLCLGCLYAVAGCFLIFNTDPSVRSDAYGVFESALSMNEGRFSSLEPGGYLYIYPHQLGLATFERILMAFSADITFFFLANLVMMIAINFIQWKCCQMLFDNGLARRYTILLSFLFLPGLFSILFVYGLIPGLFFLYIGVYGLISWLYGRGKFAPAAAVFGVGMACLIRNNYLIGAIAVFIILFMDFLKEVRWKSLILALAIVAAALIPGKLLTWGYEAAAGADLSRGIPKIMWVTMGLQDNEGSSFVGGWFNGYNYNVYMDKDMDPETSGEQAKEDLNDRVSELLGDPAKAAVFFGTKAISTWTDPLFQSIWSGPLEDMGQYTHKGILKNIYTGQEGYEILMVLCAAILFIIYGGAVLGIFLRPGGMKCGLDLKVMFPFLFLVGGFLFHLVWETKSQYVFPFVMMLIPGASFGLVLFKERLERLRRKTGGAK